MIGLQELFKLAEAAFPGSTIGLQHLLAVWARHDDEGELIELFRGTGLSIEYIASTLEPYVSAPEPEDRHIVTECIASVSNESHLGRHLWEVVCRFPDHRISRSLVSAGLDLEKLQRRLKEQEKAHALLMAHQADHRKEEYPGAIRRGPIDGLPREKFKGIQGRSKGYR